MHPAGIKFGLTHGLLELDGERVVLSSPLVESISEMARRKVQRRKRVGVLFLEPESELEVGGHERATHRGLALALAEQGKNSEAVAEYREALRLQPDSIAALNNLAWMIAHQKGRGTEALELINRAIEVMGPHPSLLDTRGVVTVDTEVVDLTHTLRQDRGVACPVGGTGYRLR